MGRDDDMTMFEDDLETEDTDDDTEFQVDDFNDLDDDTEVKERRQAQAKVKAKLDADRAKATQREAALMGSLKQAWASDALKDYPLADVDSIGLTGIDDAAKEKFLAEVKATHEAREHALAQAGYVRTDAEGNPIAPPAPEVAAPASGSQIELERQAAAGWGKPLTGTDVQPNERAQNERELLESMTQGPKAVIDLMFKKNKGLTNWITRK